jgi:hypothetical protein
MTSIYTHLDGQNVCSEVLAEARVVVYQHRGDKMEHVILKGHIICRRGG